MLIKTTYALITKEWMTTLEEGDSKFLAKKETWAIKAMSNLLIRTVCIRYPGDMVVILNKRSINYIRVEVVENDSSRMGNSAAGG